MAFFMSNRIQKFSFSDLPAALAGLAFQDTTTGGQQPRLVPLQNTLDHLSKLGAKTVFKQYPVQDPDYFAEYEKYYAKAFANIDKYCTRFHFFAEPSASSEDPLTFLDRKEAQETYLGFVTVRPVRSSPVAASILRPLDKPDGHFVLAQDSFDVHLAGVTLRVAGTPFMQQDNAVGACAQASIWMALRTLRKKEGNSAYDPAQITAAATRFLVRGRTLPNREGLSIEQIVEAIRFAGYSPHILYVKEPGNAITPQDLAEAKRKIYAYVESEIPVILGLYPNIHTGHAVVVIGHGWNTTATPTLMSEILAATNHKIQIFHSVNWVSGFWVHNDNTGPYTMLPDHSATSYALDHVSFAIPLLPSDVFISGEEAEEVALRILNEEILKGLPDEATSTTSQLVARTYLAERHKFRNWVTDNITISRTLREHYRTKEFPRRIWITEICIRDGYENVSDGRLIRVGEVLVDPTGDPNDGPFLCAHANLSALTKDGTTRGILIDRSYEGAIRVVRIEDEASYPALCRFI